ACRCGSTCRSNGSSTAFRRTDGGRSLPIARRSNACIMCGAPRTSRPTRGSTRAAAVSTGWANRWWTGSVRTRITAPLMRYLVLTDIHANLEALAACLAHADGRGYDQTLVLGDLVGYGADPNAVVERVQALKPSAIVRGNHDKVACGIDQADGFNAV